MAANEIVDGVSGNALAARSISVERPNQRTELGFGEISTAADEHCVDVTPLSVAQGFKEDL
jgi:hypothetical protein